MQKSISSARVLLTMLLVFLALQPAAYAATVFVTDLCRVNLRSGPGTGYKVTATLSSGSMLELLEQRGEWSHVRMLREGKKPLEGWILKKFLVDKAPWEAQVRAMNASLKDKMARLQQENEQLRRKENELTGKLQTTTKKLANLETEYESLKSGAANYIELKEQYESAKTALVQAKKDVQELTKEIDNLKLSERIKWFIAGALVLLLGWFIGLIMGRHQKKRRMTYY